MASSNSKEDAYDEYTYEDFDLSDSDQEPSLHTPVPDDGPVIDVLEESGDLMEVESQANVSTPMHEECQDKEDMDESRPRKDITNDDSKWQAPKPLSRAILPSLELNDKARVTICKQPFVNEAEWDAEQMEKDAFRALVLDQTKLALWLARRRLISNESYCTNCPRPIAMGLITRNIAQRLLRLAMPQMWTTVSCEVAYLKRETDRLEGVIEIAEGAYLDPPRICALAGVERFGNRCFLIRLPQERCNQKLLIRFIRHRVKPGSTIITSDWPGYKPLGDLPEGYAHLVADPDRNVTIQKADNLLEQLAMFIDELQTDCREQFSSILDEFVWRRICTEKRFSRFKGLIESRTGPGHNVHKIVRVGHVFAEPLDWSILRSNCLQIAEGAYLDPPRICALAGVERFGNRCFLIRLPQERCNQKLLIRFIRHRVKPGSTIITSDWPGYKPLGDLPEGYAHLVADPDRNVTIQKADNLLEQLAMFIDELQTDCREQFSSILDEFVWRRICTEKRFSRVCYILAQLYNVS
ncbi:hypothetical protein AHF37_09988 [Paragonimus kellicotti]|nr:hypothetical protein AHF37_09988 [Paragonimus kellicotti]